MTEKSIDPIERLYWRILNSLESNEVLSATEAALIRHAFEDEGYNVPEWEPGLSPQWEENE